MVISQYTNNLHKSDVTACTITNVLYTFKCTRVDRCFGVVAMYIETEC